MNDITFDLDNMTTSKMRELEKVLVKTISSINNTEERKVWFQILGVVSYAHERKFMKRKLDSRSMNIVELYKGM